MHSSVIHVKMKPKTAQSLKLLSQKRSMPVGELVRQAVSRCYQLDTMELAEKQRLALAAYQGGYISIGKLSEEMGMTVIETRLWLGEHDIPQNISFTESDIKNA
jgi:predicted HTH domain antitoxin